MRATIFLVAILGVAQASAAEQRGGAASTTTTTTGGRGSATVMTPEQRQNLTVTLRPGGPLVFEVGVRRYQADGRLGGSASDSASADTFQSYVWANPGLCSLSLSSVEPAGAAGVGWHFSGTIVSRTPEQITANVEWRRIFENGARVNGQVQTARVTLRDGERFEFDRVTPAGGSSCGAAEAKLEASVAARPVTRLATTGIGRGRGGRASVTRPSRPWPVLEADAASARGWAAM